ncbi:HK97 gp10 family phage protein [Enterovirga rhinocerotis]|uniref:Uncharacterized protein n=1 Tax=Enterovirga rhinocerotis TaxID=1339210 RepID=A0A4R7BUP0_9HYPH|nr:HK97 gp10 family phage protein [Enterovirga rhinocerotis]TDR89113.1 hypothetical protein EV668_3601 [Enterovirga rhinocerotis]
MARLRPFDEITRVVVDRCLSPQAQGRMVAAAARTIIADAESQNAAILGRAPAKEIYVDRRLGAPLESVSVPKGTISVEFKLANETVLWVRDMLRQHAPVLTGRFRASILLFADGRQVDPDGEIPLAEEYEFISDAPYARKIEGDLKRKPQSSKAPDGVFHAVAVLAQKRFHNVAAVGFSYRSLPSGGVGRWAATGSARAMARTIRGGQERLHREWLTRQPAVTILPR